MQIIQSFIKQGRRNRPGYFLKPSYITMHDTANAQRGANAKAHVNYFKGDAAASIPASVHFIIDDKVIYQILPLDEVAWHAGDGTYGTGNRKSIGIEICMNADGDRLKAEDNAAWLVAKLRQDFSLPKEAVVQHNKWSSTSCPIILKTRWASWLKKVDSYMTQTKVPVVSGPLPKIIRAIPIEHDGKFVSEVGYLISYEGTYTTLVRATYFRGLPPSEITGEGTYLKITTM